MKKLLLAFSILLISFTAVNAQDTSSDGGFKRGGGGSEMREKMKQRLKDEISLTDSQIDSVMTIQQEFQKKSKELKKESLEADKLKEKTEQIEAERKEKFKSFLSDDQVNKLEAFYEKVKKMREHKKNSEGSNPS